MFTVDYLKQPTICSSSKFLQEKLWNVFIQIQTDVFLK